MMGSRGAQQAVGRGRRFAAARFAAPLFETPSFAALLPALLLPALLLHASPWPATAGAAPEPPHPFDTPALAFSVRPELMGAPSAASVPACPADDPGGRPDGAAPAHAAVVFAGTRPLPPDATLACNLPNFDFAQLRVFSVADYGRVFPAAARALAELRRVLDDGVPPPDARWPFVPYLEAFPAFGEHVAFLSFGNGRGVVFLTQWMIEPDAIGGHLVYVFQGLSADGTRYVLGLFPVQARAPLPPFPLPPDESAERTYARFRTYAAGVARRVGEAPAGDFTPDLGELLALLRSLRVK